MSRARRRAVLLPADPARQRERKREQQRARAARTRIKELAEQLGKDPDRCVRCGKKPRGRGSMHWHHVDPTTKGFSIGDTRNYRRNDEEKLAELAKCERICKTCHYYQHSTATNKVKDRGQGKGWAVNMNFPTEREARIAHETLEALRRKWNNA